MKVREIIKEEYKKFKEDNFILQIIKEEVYRHIDEALPLDVAKYYTDIKNPELYEHYNKVFGNKHRLYFDLGGNPVSVDKRTGQVMGSDTTQEDSSLLQGINALLGPLDFEVTDYDFAVNKKSNQKMKLGKAFNIAMKKYKEDQKAINQLNNYLSQIQKLKTARGEQKLATGDDKLIVVSRHPYDLAGMSTDRSWRSCMHITDGSNKDYVTKDIIGGSLVAYLINKTDLNINNPLGRVLIKPYVNTDTTSTYPEIEQRGQYSYERSIEDYFKTGDVMLYPTTVYGSTAEGFESALLKISDSFNKVLYPESSGVIYHMHCELYPEGDTKITNIDYIKRKFEGKVLSPDEIENLGREEKVVFMNLKMKENEPDVIKNWTVGWVSEFKFGKNNQLAVIRIQDNPKRGLGKKGYFFVDNNGKLSLDNVNLDELGKVDNSGTYLSAYFNTLKRKPYIDDISPYGFVFGGGNLASAFLQGKLNIFINKKGDASLDGLSTITQLYEESGKNYESFTRLLPAYFNTLKGKKLYRHVYPLKFKTPEGTVISSSQADFDDYKDIIFDETSLFYGVEPSADDDFKQLTRFTIIDSKGNPSLGDLTQEEVNKFHTVQLKAQYYNQLYGDKVYTHIHKFFQPYEGSNLATMKGDLDRYNVIINAQGKPDLNGMSLEDFNAKVRENEKAMSIFGGALGDKGLALYHNTKRAMEGKKPMFKKIRPIIPNLFIGLVDDSDFGGYGVFLDNEGNFKTEGVLENATKIQPEMYETWEFFFASYFNTLSGKVQYSYAEQPWKIEENPQNYGIKDEYRNDVTVGKLIKNKDWVVIDRATGKPLAKHNPEDKNKYKPDNN